MHETEVIPNRAASIPAEAKVAVLVVDDDLSNRESLSRRLLRRGYEVATAAGGPEALRLLDEREFDVVLLDVMMPGMNGLEVLEKIRRTRPPTQLPVVMATAKDDTEDIVKAFSLGANDYVTKPLDFAVVLARVQTQVLMRQAVARALDLDRRLRDRNIELESANAQLLRAAERATAELRAAAEVQAAFLPKFPPPVAGVRCAWAFEPCQELAGDSLNAIALDDHHVGLYVLDVSGHGVAASLLAVAATRLLSTIGNTDSLLLDPAPDGGLPQPADPAKVAAQLNERLPWNDATRQFLTLYYATLDAKNGLFTYTSAGHPPAVRVPAQGTPHLLEGSGLPIGLATEPYDRQQIQLNPGDRVYLYTDGITEAMNADRDLFGDERLMNALHEGSSLDLKHSINLVMQRIHEWRGIAPNRDDATVLAVEYYR